MISLTTTLSCPHCGKALTCDFSDHVKQFYEMDGCTSYQVEYEVEMTHRCPHCGKSIESFGSFWEYPEGTVHMVSIRNF